MFLPIRDFLINPSDILTQLYSSGQKTAGFSHPEIKGATIITKPFSNVHAEWGMIGTPKICKNNNNKKPYNRIICGMMTCIPLNDLNGTSSGYQLVCIDYDSHPMKLLQSAQWFTLYASMMTRIPQNDSNDVIIGYHPIFSCWCPQSSPTDSKADCSRTKSWWRLCTYFCDFVVTWSLSYLWHTPAPRDPPKMAILNLLVDLLKSWHCPALWYELA